MRTCWLAALLLYCCWQWGLGWTAAMYVTCIHAEEDWHMPCSTTSVAAQYCEGGASIPWWLQLLRCVSLVRCQGRSWMQMGVPGFGCTSGCVGICDLGFVAVREAALPAQQCCVSSHKVKRNGVMCWALLWPLGKGFFYNNHVSTESRWHWVILHRRAQPSLGHPLGPAVTLIRE